MTEKNKTLLILVLGVFFHIIIFFKSDGYGEFLRFEIRDTWVWNFFESIVEVFNEDILNSNPIYKLEYNRYSYQGETGLKFNTECSNYSKAGQAIQNEIAIALLPKDAVNNINSIIERIANKFKIDLGGS